MLLQIDEQISVDNLGNYSTEIVDQLRKLLLSGASARPDPIRKDFYDVENGDRVFFIHASSVSGKVMLLATWLRVLADLPAENIEQVPS